MASTAPPQSASTSASEIPLLTPTPEGRARFSRQAYHRLFDIGVRSRVELIDGEVFMMSPIGPPQGSLTSRLMTFFVTQLPGSLACRVQLPIVVSDHSEPEPDVAIVRCRDDDYQHDHPSPADVVLLIEVAQSSLVFDLGKKAQLYAQSGIPEYWVVDVDRCMMHIHRDPSGTQYRVVEQLTGGSFIAPLVAPDCRLELAWLFR